MAAKTQKQRLQALEQAERQALGTRIVKQSLTDPGVFYDEHDRATSQGEIDALSAAGWQVIKIVYAQDWRRSGEV